MSQLKMMSPDLTAKNIDKIAELFPMCVTEVRDVEGHITRAIDFDLLKQELSASLVEGPVERYQLDWPGKRESLLAANAPIAKTLRPSREESVNFDETENLFIEGDNLEALKLLQESYLGKVKMIYIDPPYNTGNDFVYNDDFAENSDEYLERSLQKDEEGNRLVTNPESSGRFHSDWLSMMHSRLRLARNLLTDDGVIFISIDDNEQANLKKLCDEVFGEINCISILSVENNPKGRKNSKFVSNTNEFCYIYAKNKDCSYFLETIPKSEKDMKKDENGDYVHGSGKRVLVGQNNFNKLVTNIASEKNYAVYYRDVDGDMVFRKCTSIKDIDEGLLNKGYRRYISYRDDALVENTYTQQKMQELHNNNALEIQTDKIFEKNFESKIRIKSIITNKRYKAILDNKVVDYVIDINSTSAGRMLKSLFKTEAVLFNMPKNIGLLKIFLELIPDKNYHVLDFFAGSSTTAHAVMQLNAEDGGNRKFIMVQLPEKVDEKHQAYNAGYHTIAEISKERIRRAGKQILESDEIHEDWNRDIGFRVLKVDSSNMKEVYYQPQELTQADLLDQVDNVKEDRTPEDLLFQVMLDWGLELSLPITTEEIEGKKVFFVADDALIACFDAGITESLVKTLAERAPLRLLFRDNHYLNNDTKINAEQLIKQIAPNTELKSI